MSPNAPGLTAMFLYSRKDEAFKEKFADYLRLLEQGGCLSTLAFQDIESLSPYRFADIVEDTDLFLFGCSAHLFAHPNMREGIFRRMARYHCMGRLRAVALACRPWKLEETVLHGLIHLPENGQAVNSSAWESEDDACLHIYTSLRELCREWQEKKNQLELSWKQAQGAHGVEAYNTFLRRYPHSRYSAEARNLAENLWEKELWSEATERKSLLQYYRYMQFPAQHKENLQEAALNITKIEEDEERLWADTAARKGPEFFFLYKAMFPQGRYLEEANKQIRKFLKKRISLAAGHIKALENQYLMYLAYRRLPPEEFFSLSFYLAYRARLDGRQEKISNALSSKPIRYPVYIFVAIVLAFSLFSMKVEGMLLSGWLLAFLAAAAGLALHFMAQYRLRQDLDIMRRSGLALKQASAFLKVGFLANDDGMVRDTLILLTRIEQQMETIEHKNFLHYLLPDKQPKPEWMGSKEAA